MAEAQISQVRAITRRMYDKDGPAWLVMLIVGLAASRDWWDARPPTGVPMATAVVDDFGNLVLVTGWQ